MTYPLVRISPILTSLSRVFLVFFVFLCVRVHHSLAEILVFLEFGRMNRVTRRTFLAGCSLTLASRAAERLPIRKAVLLSMLPTRMSILDRFQLARDTGFEQIECGTTDDVRQAEEILAASKQTGVRIHSVMNRDHWKYPLSARDPEVVAKSVEGLKTSFRNASLWGADTVLLVPAVVNADT